jgi:hypothetical protein
LIISSGSQSSSSVETPPGVTELNLSVSKSCHAVGCFSLGSGNKLETLSPSSQEWKLEPAESSDEREELARGENPMEGKVPILKGEEGGFCFEDRLLPFLDVSSKLEKEGEIGDRRAVCVGVPDLRAKSVSGIYACELTAVGAPWLVSVVCESGGGERKERGDGWFVKLPKTSELFSTPSTVQLLFLLWLFL